MTAAASRSRPRLPRPLRPGQRLLPVLLAAVLVAGLTAACTVNPTPYQPLAENGGYDEARLQKDVYRVSFRGNSATLETNVLDYTFRRCAEVTLAHGYTHFLIEEDYGRTRLTLRSTGARVGVGVGFSSRSSFWGMGFGGPLSEPEYTPAVSYHLAIFVIRLLTPEEAAKVPEAQRAKLFDAADLLHGGSHPGPARSKDGSPSQGGSGTAPQSGGTAPAGAKAPGDR